MNFINFKLQNHLSAKKVILAFNGESNLITSLIALKITFSLNKHFLISSSISQCLLDLVLSHLNQIGIDCFPTFKVNIRVTKLFFYAKVKDYSKERNKVLTYFEVGKLLSETGKEYGNDIIGSYAEKLAIEVGKKYNARTLRRIRQFYNVFKDEKWSPSATVLTWSHYTELLVLNDINKINYYN